MTRVLVVDDHPDNQYYLQALLQANGYTVNLAANGVQALEQARQNRPDLIVSDLLMPEMDGYSLLKAWKADPDLANVPFVVYTATYTDPDDEALARQLGADDFLLKPCEPEVMLRVVKQALRRPATSPSSAGGPSGQGNEQHDIFQQHSQTLIRKLEERSRQLEQANRALELDILERTRAEAALRVSEERFRLLAQATSDAAWDINLETRARWWGSGLQRVFGHVAPATDAADDHWQSCIPPDDRDHVLESRRQAISSMSSWNVSYRFARSNGSWAHIEDRGLVLGDEQGKPVRMVGGLTDVTRRAALEAQLARSQRLEAVGQLTGGVAHDFNNLLTVVLGNAQVLIEQAGDRSDLKKIADLILKAADRGASLTRQLLAFASKQVLEPRAVDLHQLVADIIPLLQSAVGSAVTIDIRTRGQTAPVIVDAMQLESALVNLAVNARDAMCGSGRLVFQIKQVQGSELANAYGKFSDLPLYAGIEVSDTGTGIRPEHIDRVFEPFFTTKSGGKGSGLGLAMVFGFVRQSQGVIDVTSSWSHGSTFALYFPVAQGHQLPAPDSGAQNTQLPRGTETVLLVDDDGPVRQVLAAHLSWLGYSVIQASAGDQALAELASQEKKVDLLLTDIMMPGMTGYELARKASALQPSLRVLYSTGYQGPQQADIDTKRTPVLQKPYKREVLARSVRQVLDQK